MYFNIFHRLKFIHSRTDDGPAQNKITFSVNKHKSLRSSLSALVRLLIKLNRADWFRPLIIADKSTGLQHLTEEHTHYCWLNGSRKFCSVCFGILNSLLWLIRSTSVEAKKKHKLISINLVQRSDFNLERAYRVLTTTARQLD